MRLAIAISLACAALAACNPYDPDLPDRPFLCGEGDPPCPSGYSCDVAASPPACVETREGPDGGADGLSGECTGAGDLLEPNNAMNMPTQTSVADTREFIEFVGVTICPADDVDYYFMNAPTNGPNLDVTITFDPTDGALSLRIINSTGTTVATGNTVGGGGTIKAVLSNASQGQYYAVVQAMPGDTTGYSILIDSRRL